MYTTNVCMSILHIPNYISHQRPFRGLNDMRIAVSFVFNVQKTSCNLRERAIYFSLESWTFYKNLYYYTTSTTIPHKRPLKTGSFLLSSYRMRLKNETLKRTLVEVEKSSLSWFKMSWKKWPFIFWKKGGTLTQNLSWNKKFVPCLLKLYIVYTINSYCSI